jgi:hypothetical protein
LSRRDKPAGSLSLVRRLIEWGREVSNPKVKLILNVVGGCFVLLLVVAALAGATSPPNKAVDAAIAECRAKGWSDKDLGLSTAQVSNYGLVGTAAIALNSKDPNRPKTIRVQLRNWLNLLGWQLVDYKEE